jgi:hypothetical protein
MRQFSQLFELTTESRILDVGGYKFNWLSRRIQRLFLRNVTVWGWITRPTSQHCESFMNEVRLLSSSDLQRLFPDADIMHERFLGLSKSIMAVKNS